MFTKVLLFALLSTQLLWLSLADDPCAGLPSYAQLKAALKCARGQSNAGFNLDMWGTIVNRDGVVCAVAFTGQNRGSQWPGSRVISAQKANTANAFSLAGVALSTANLYSAVQPGGSLFGLGDSNPVATDVAYGGNPSKYGQSNDPMTGQRIGGVNTFGGGLALYDSEGHIIGGLGVSGDTSCADHFISWRTRHQLRLDNLANVVGPSGNFAAGSDDQIIFDISGGVSASGWGQPHCLNAANENQVLAGLPGQSSALECH